MKKQFIFFYTMKENAPEIRDVIPSHVTYWRRAALEGYTGGPFADRSGGLITFRATDLAETTAVAEKDPFVVRGLLHERWTKEWLPE